MRSPKHVFTLKRLGVALVWVLPLCGLLMFWYPRWGLLVAKGALLGFLQWAWIGLESRLAITKLQWTVALFRAALLGAAMALLGGGRVASTVVVFAGFLSYKMALLGLIGFGLARPVGPVPPLPPNTTK
jgi:hypothetical protein